MQALHSGFSVKQAPSYRAWRSRQPQVCCAVLRNPYSILGVDEAADIQDVKKAYRQLARQFHPDVCKAPDAQVKFVSIQEAYELITGRARGKEGTDHSQSNSWDFHDWYWSFRVNRSWSAQQAGGSAHTAHMPGYQQPEAKENVQSQLAGLRHRAAVRAQKRRGASPSPVAHSRNDVPSASDTRAQAAADMPQGPAEVMSATHHAVVDGHFGTVLGNAVPFPGHTIKSDSGSFSTSAAGAGSTGLQYHAQASQMRAEQHDHHVDEEPAEPFSSQARPRRPFVASSDSRHGVANQLEGLRRKAGIKAQTPTHA